MADRLIATEPLFRGRARAANKGDVIPKSTLDNNPQWKDKVAREGTKAAAQAETSAAPSEPKKS